MIVPQGWEKMTEKELAKALEKKYGEAAAYLAGKLKGTIEDDQVIQ